jgi:hypothetical protein
MTDERDEIKAILDRAFTPEPALGLDRDEVYRRGHQQVRNRRLLTSGGVVLGVVAVVLGVAALTGVLRKGADEDTAAPPVGVTSPPQALTSSVQVAPPGPALPLPPSTTAPLPASAGEHAVLLTKALSGSGMFPGEFTVLAAEPNTDPLVFQFVDGSYRTTALLVDTRGRGVLIIDVQRAARGESPPKCADVKECTVWSESGVAGAASTARNTSGTVEYSVDALRPDSTRVILLATNAASTRWEDSPATRPEPPVDLKQLRVLATLPGLAYG